VSVDRGTMARWLEEPGGTLGATVLHAMRIEALLASAMCLSTDATGVLVQQGRRRRRAPAAAAMSTDATGILVRQGREPKTKAPPRARNACARIGERAEGPRAEDERTARTASTAAPRGPV
jgi:hypothetical protein